MITFTAKAAKYIKKLLDKEGIVSPPGGMRFGIKAGGCSGFYYFFKPAENSNINDHIVTCSDVLVFVDNKSMKKIEGTTIDRSDNLIDGDFLYKNPHAKSTCGCGISIDFAE